MKRIAIILIITLTTGFISTGQNSCTCKTYSLITETKKEDSITGRNMIQNESEPFCKAKGFEILAGYFKKNSLADSAEFYLEKAEKIYSGTNCGIGSAMQVYKYKGQLLHAKGDIPGAIQQFLKMGEAAQANDDVYQEATACSMIAQMFNQSGQAENGLLYTRKAISILGKINAPDQKMELLFKISHRLIWHYQETKKNSSLDSSEYFGNEQLRIAREVNSRKYLGSGYLHLQGILWERWYHTRSNPLTAAGMDTAKRLVSLLDSALKYTDRNTYNVMGSIYSDKAVIAMELFKDPKDSRKFTDSCIFYWEKTGNIAYRVYEYHNIAGAYKIEGDYKGAYEYYKKATQLSDSLENVEKTKQVAELEKKYNQAKNENTIKDLDKKKQLYLFLAIAGLLAALAIGFFLRQQSLKHKKNILETEQRLNRARMNPHFFFNALTALQKFALRENDGQAMASNLSKFSNIMRETLESTYKEYVTIEQEIEFLNEYLEVQKIRFPQTFSYEVTADVDLGVDELQIPAMIIQPFVENSIEHGFIGVDYPGKVTVTFTKENKELLIKITDNGKGLSTNTKENNEHISRASQIIKDRIYLLNIKLKSKAGFSIDNDASGKGVLVKIHLPLLYKDEQKA